MNYKVFCLVFFLGVAVSLPTINFDVEANENQHHTESYKIRNKIDPNDDARMILRRGFSFVIEVNDETLYSFALIPFNPIDDSREDTNVIDITLVKQINPSGGWQATYGQTSSGWKYSIYIPPTSAVGSFYWVLVDKDGSQTTLENQLIVLFNPWSSSDPVYNPDESDLDEFVMNNQAIIYSGSSDDMGEIGWVYDQFHYAVLEVTLYFISQMPFEDRSDVIMVSRHLSSWVNVNDNDGLVWGNWGDSFAGGKNPTYWTGSLEIFQKYRKVQQGVKYGQCWVFAGCLTSSGRTLGIPSRSITNFESAHESQDTSGTYRYAMHIDTFWDSNGKFIGNEGGSVWNFHVWCEFWFSRQDLSGVNGWQAVDATPQEVSDDLFQMGPAALGSIKSKDRDAKYDADFVISEVGAVLYDWVQFDTGKEKHPTKKGFWLMDVNNDGTGKMMSTKAIGSMTRQDITSNYKGTFHSPKTRPTHINSNSDVTFQITTAPIVPLGTNIVIFVESQCPSCTQDSTKMLQITGQVRMISYIGEPIALLKEGIVNLTLTRPTESHNLTITPVEYEPFLGMNRLVDYNAFVKLYENDTFTGEYASLYGRIPFTYADLVITPILNETGHVVITVSWTNPISATLHNGLVRISGGFVVEQDIIVGTINGKENLVLNNLEVYHDTPKDETITVFVRLLTDDFSPVQGRLDIPN